MSEIDIYNSIALKIRKLEKEKKKAKMTEEELRKSLEFVCEERIKLQEQVKDLQYKNEEKDKEIDRLSNIINELESYIENVYHGFPYTEWIHKSEVLDKINELKENRI